MTSRLILTKNQLCIWVVGLFLPTIAALFDLLLSMISNNIRLIGGLKISLLLSLIICTATLLKSKLTLRSKCLSIIGTILLLGIQTFALGFLLISFTGMDGTR